MRREPAVIMLNAGTYSVVARLDVEELNAEQMPVELTGTLEYGEGSAEHFAVHSTEPDKRIWLLGNRFGYKFKMCGAGHEFTATFAG
jgi:hypothetical protein